VSTVRSCPVEAHDEWQVTADGRYLSEVSVALLTAKTAQAKR
jgi:hypothetical protein